MNNVALFTEDAAGCAAEAALDTEDSFTAEQDLIPLSAAEFGQNSGGSELADIHRVLTNSATQSSHELCYTEFSRTLIPGSDKTLT